ncbi:MAG: ABC transporter family substrate-binding protein, partial [Chloroflexi bacterium]|nr:ABC transporter family substrate-binding protein [Chloroflexota bacterium]
IAAACGSDDDDGTAGGGADTTAEGGGDEGAAPAESPCPENEVTGEPVEGGSVTFAAEQVVQGFSPLRSAHNSTTLGNVAAFIYPGVQVVQPDGSVTMNEDLLVSMELTSEDPQTVEYVIQEDAVWSDGTPITGADFDYTWQQLNGSNPDSDAASTTGYEDIETLTVDPEDPKRVTVVYGADTPFADWQALFDYLYPAHIMEARGIPFGESFDTDDVPDFSGGPFLIDDYQLDSVITFVPNPEWYGEPPLLDSINYQLGIEAGTLAQSFENNEIDMAYPQPQVDLVSTFQALQPAVACQITAGFSFEHIDFNLQNEFLQDLEVRQAIAFGLDRDDLVARTIGQFDPTAVRLDNRLILTTEEDYQSNAGEFETQDQDRARELLEGAGFTEGADGIYERDGEPLSLRITTTGGNQLREVTEQIIQDQLREVGIDIVIDNEDGSAAFDRFFPESGAPEDRDFDIALFAWVGTPFVSSQKSLYETFNAETGAGGQNEMFYSNPEVDALLQEVIRTTDEAEITEIVNEIDTLLWEDMVTIPLYTKPNFLPYDAGIANVIDNPTTAGPLWNATEWGFVEPE